MTPSLHARPFRDHIPRAHNGVMRTLLLALALLPSFAPAVDLDAAAKSLAAALPPDWAILRTEPAELAAVPARHVVLRQNIKVYDHGPQQQQARAQFDGDAPEPKFEIAHNHAELFLVTADAAPAPVDAIPWDRTLAQRHHVRPVILGTRDGVRWLARAPLAALDHLRTALKLEGDDPIIPLAINCLTVRGEPEEITRYAAHDILHRIGERAVAPLLAEATAAAAFPDRTEIVEQSIRALGSIRGKAADAALRGLYESGNEVARRSVAYALIATQRRDDLKPLYLDMLRRRLYTGNAAEQAARAGWKDALPILREIDAAPPTFWEWRQVADALRAFDNRPIPKELGAAKRTLMFGDQNPAPPTPDQIAAARQTILTHTDRDAAVLVAIDLARAVTKGTMRQSNAYGRELLRDLPATATGPTLAKLEKITDESDRKDTLKRLRGE